MLSKLNSTKTIKVSKNLVPLIYSFINTLLIQSYEEEFDFEECRIKESQFANLIRKIIIVLKNKFSLQVHEDVLAIVSEWSKKKKKKNENDSEDSDEEEKVE